LGQQIYVARHQRRLRDDADGIPELGEHLEAAPRDPARPLDGLVAVGVAGERDELGLPPRREKRLPQKLWRVRLHHDAALEVDAGVEPELFVGGTRVTVAATVLAAPIRVQAPPEPDVRALVLRQDRAARVAVVDG